MKKTMVLLFALSLQGAFGFNKDFILVNDRAPLEFSLLFESLKARITNPTEQLRLIVGAEHINKGMGPLKKDQAFFLFKSEIYKTLLEWPHAPSTFELRNQSFFRALTDFKKNQAAYSPFSQWIIEAIFADLRPFANEGLFDISPSEARSLSGDKLKRHLKAKRILKYDAKWVEQVLMLSPEDFNKLADSVSWRVLIALRDKTLFFSRHAGHAIEDVQTNTFNIPETPNIPKRVPKREAQQASTLTEESAKEKTKATQAVERLDVAPGSVPSKDLSKAIDQIDTDPQGSTAPSTDDSNLK